MKNETKKAKRLNNANQNIERNRAHSGPGYARDFSRGEGRRDGKKR